LVREGKRGHGEGDDGQGILAAARNSRTAQSGKIGGGEPRIRGGLVVRPRGVTTDAGEEEGDSDAAETRGNGAAEPGSARFC
jgi:hypothetical protein